MPSDISEYTKCLKSKVWEKVFPTIFKIYWDALPPLAPPTGKISQLGLVFSESSWTQLKHIKRWSKSEQILVIKLPKNQRFLKTKKMSEKTHKTPLAPPTVVITGRHARRWKAIQKWRWPLLHVRGRPRPLEAGTSKWRIRNSIY